jgi:AcrR family transcriptional regulator
MSVVGRGVEAQQEPLAERGGARLREHGRRRGRARADQGSRLLRAIVEVVAQHGYSEAKIGEIAARAHVSRASFYEHFASKEECFLCAQRELNERVATELASAAGQAEPSATAAAVVASIVALAQREPFAFAFLTHEAMLAGPRALEQRDRLIGDLEALIEHAKDDTSEHTPSPDLPARLLLTGVVRVLGLRMRRGAGDPAPMLGDLIAWMNAYAVPRGAHRWRTLEPNRALVGADRDLSGSPPAPEPLPKGRHRLPEAVVARVQRERVRHATAEVVRARGYAHTTVADIVAAAGVSREAFYANFGGKREAFLDSFKQGFEQTLVRTANAFFTAPGAWPDRVWAAGEAFIGFLASAPGLAYLGFVESYALGPAEARSTDDTFLGFTAFLEDGYRYRPEAAELPRLLSEAIAGAVMETAATFVREGRLHELRGLLPSVTYLILAPFTGPQEATEFVERKLEQLALAADPRRRLEEAARS